MASDASTKFIMSMFEKHYKEAALEMPERFSKREFGFMLFDRPGMIRHTGFSTRADLKRFLTERVPAHVYYSSAYYEKPDAPTMAEKKWLGADLIFDLDADHISGAVNLPYEEMLHLVKSEVSTLVDEFIMGDFGFEEDEVRIVFSGGRGYHVHVRSPRVLKLSSHERREIVDYVTATDIDVEWVFPRQPVVVGSYKGIPKFKHNRTMVKSTDGGWKGKIRGGIERLFSELDSLPPENREEYLKSRIAEAIPGKRKDIVNGLCKELLAGAKGGRIMDSITEGNNLMRLEDRYLEAFTQFVVAGIASKIAGETDEPVTSDIKRLIRLPSSLHGKTGFEVVPLRRDDLDGFDPFRDAVPKIFGETSTEVYCRDPANVRLRDRGFSLDVGKNSVPEYVALYLICRRLATIPA